MLSNEKSLSLDDDYLAGTSRVVTGTRVEKDLLVQRLLLRAINSIAAYVNDPDGSPEFVLYAQAYLDQALEDVRHNVEPSTFIMYKRFARAHALEACYD